MDPTRLAERYREVEIIVWIAGHIGRFVVGNYCVGGRVNNIGSEIVHDAEEWFLRHVYLGVLSPVDAYFQPPTNRIVGGDVSDTSAPLHIHDIVVAFKTGVLVRERLYPPRPESRRKTNHRNCRILNRAGRDGVGHRVTATIPR